MRSKIPFPWVIGSLLVGMVLFYVGLRIPPIGTAILRTLPEKK